MSEDKQQNQQQPEAAVGEDDQAAAEQGRAEGGDERVAALEAEVAQLKDQLLRAMAETENVRRRLEQQAEDRGKYAIAGFAKDMLQVADNLARALEAVPETARQESDVIHNLTTGVEMTERELMTAFERYGIRAVPGLGSRFDPNIHQAMMEVDDPSQPSGTVVMVMQNGYTIQDRLLRPAMVGVSKGGPKPGNGEGPQRVDTQA